MFQDNLRYYRLLRQMSQAELAEKIHATPMTISNYEKGKRTPNNTTIIKLCDALQVTAADLFSDLIGDAQITHDAFRKSDKLFDAETDLILCVIDRQLGRVHNILSILTDAVLPSVPSADKMPHTSPKADAIALRRYLCLPQRGPVGNVVDLLENKGFLVCQINNVNSNFSGISGTLNGRPYIVVNGDMSPSRQRFTLIHELVHIVFDLPENALEKTVDQISGMFFLPEEDALCEFGPRRTNILGDMKHVQREYGMSAQSVLVRAKQAGIISSSVFNEHANWLDQHHGADQVVSEHCCMMEKLVSRAVSEDMIGMSKAAELLEVPILDAQRICGRGLL